MKKQRSHRYGGWLVGGLALAGLLALGGQRAGLWHFGASQGTVALILKTEKNPFFRKISTAAQAEAQRLGLKLEVSYGTADGDSDTQNKAIERAIQNRVGAILITPSSGTALNASLARARQAGILVLTLDSPLADQQAFDSFIGTNNFEAGRLVGQYIASQGIAQPKVALLNLFPGHPVGIDRRNGFLNGLGHPEIKPGTTDTPSVPEVVCEQDSFGDDTKGGLAMASCLAKNPEINVVYTINEPAAAGAFRVIKSGRKQSQIRIVSVDGGCPGVEAVKRAELTATSQQFPALMASQGMQAAERAIHQGDKPPRLIDTGVKLVAAADAASVDTGLKACW